MSGEPAPHEEPPTEEHLPPLEHRKSSSPQAESQPDHSAEKHKKHHKQSTAEENDDGTPRRKKKSKHAHAAETEVQGDNVKSPEQSPEETPKKKSKHAHASETEVQDGNAESPEQSPEETRKKKSKHAHAAETETQGENGESPEETPKKDSSSSSSSSSRTENAQAVEGEGDGVLITAVDDPAQRPETVPHTPTGSDISESEPEPEPEPEEPPAPTCRYSDEDLQAALDRMLKKKRMPEMEMRPYLVDYAKNQSVYELMKENYDQAAKIDEAIDALMQSLHRDEDAQDCEKQTESLKEKYQTAQKQNKTIQDEFAQRIEQLKETENKRLQELEQQHEKERSEFEEQWARPETTSTFTKPSAGLLQVRKMQKSMAIAHKFEEAKRLKAAGDEMQREESVVASQKAVGAMKMAYQQLIDKQEREVDCFMANGYRKLQTLETERDRKLQANEKLRNQLDTRIKGPKVPRRPPVPIPDLQPADQRGSVTGIISTRTRSQLAVYKKSPETTRLQIKMGDIQKITKPMTPSPKKGQTRRRFV